MRSSLWFILTFVLLVALLPAVAGCTGNAPATGNTTKPPLKPKPRVVSVVESTSGTENQYFLTLDIKVKNEGAEGVVLVQAAVAQAGITRQNEMDVYIKQGATDELKLTFPLIWKGGDFVSNVQAVVP